MMRCSPNGAGDGCVAETSVVPGQRTTAVSWAMGPVGNVFTPRGSRRIGLLSSRPASVVAPGQQQSWPSSQLQSGTRGRHRCSQHGSPVSGYPGAATAAVRDAAGPLRAPILGVKERSEDRSAGGPTKLGHEYSAQTHLAHGHEEAADAD